MAHDLTSLITVVDGILEQDRVLDDHTKAILVSLLEKVTTLKSLLEKSVQQHHRLRRDETINALQSEIRVAAHEAEDMIESQAVDHQTLSEPPEASRFVMSKVMEKFDAANVKLTKIIKDYHHHHHKSSHDEGDATNPYSLIAAYDPTSSKANTPHQMVGFEEDALQLKHRLTSQRSAREIIPIVGMGGIGKTTLARNLYSDPLIVSHFDARAWVTVSQDYNVRTILLGLLGCLFGKISDHMMQQKDDELGLTLYQRLCGRRYLVILDDVWSKKAWDAIKRCFPNENHKSRILITSRELDVAKYPDPACDEHQMHLLSTAQGWDLLRQKVFDAKNEEHCPPFLEEIGQKIASNCGGLPLAISVIGGLLSIDKYSKDSWDRVARDVSSVLSHRDEHFTKILCLSYENLPFHLKPCFLYMSGFPEDFNVQRSKLVKLLVAEGFLWRSNEKNNKSLEDIAEEYLKAIVDRNLLSVARTKYDGRAESYSMHDLLRDLCVKKAEEEKFLRVFKYGNANNFRRVIVHLFTDDAPNLEEDLSCTRSLVCVSREYRWLNISPVLSTLRLLRVLDISDIYFKDFPMEILKLARLRFLAVFILGSLPSAIFKLQNLQTLIVRFYSDVNCLIFSYEACEISGLRHIIVKGGATICIDFKIPRAQENLQTICGVTLHDLLASNLIHNIPNIKKLGINGFEFVAKGRIIDLSHMHELETLKLDNFGVAEISHLKLPNRLKKLSFCWCTLPMGLVNGVGDLQYLEVLKIDSCTFHSKDHNEEEDVVEEDDDDDDPEEEDQEEEEENDGGEEEEEDNDEEEEWEINEEAVFCSLQFLSFDNLGIVSWKADYSHFPRLRHLRIRDCEGLKEIPDCIEEMSTLEMIEVSANNPCHVRWANEVRETQRREYGNESLQIRILEDNY